LKWQE